jgi:ribosomal protein S8
VGNIIETLRELNVEVDDYVYLNYEDSAEVWHISDDYIEGALGETDTAEMLATLLATRGVTVLSRYEEDILGIMRSEGLLDDYDHEDWFEQYLTEKIREEAYQYDLLTISTSRHDHKRGTCEVATNVKVTAGELYELSDRADSFVSGFEVIVQTKNGLLTLVT